MNNLSIKKSYKSNIKNNKEQVILVDKHDNKLGVMYKDEVHCNNTPLHRGFSIFIFNDKNQLLIQKRSNKKKVYPLIWSNSCCGHPKPANSLNDNDESYENAALRRCKFELGIDNLKNIKVIATFIYNCKTNNIMENEVCGIMTAKYSGGLNINIQEVADIKWIEWERWVEVINSYPDRYSPWCIEETNILLKERIK